MKLGIKYFFGFYDLVVDAGDSIGDRMLPGLSPRKLASDLVVPAMAPKLFMNK